MRTLTRNKRLLYLCKKYTDEDNIVKYKEPIPVKVNYEPMSASSQMFTFGIHYAENLQAILDLKDGKKFSEGDKCYINVKPPKVHDNLCEDADYIVSVIPQDSLNNVKINFLRLSGTVEDENSQI